MIRSHKEIYFNELQVYRKYYIPTRRITCDLRYLVLEIYASQIFTLLVQEIKSEEVAHSVDHEMIER